jgi:hypothetical protein
MPEHEEKALPDDLEHFGLWLGVFYPPLLSDQAMDKLAKPLISYYLLS